MHLIFVKRYWIFILLFLVLSFNAYALRMSRPAKFELPWTEEQITDLNLVHEQLFLMQQGRYEMDEVTSTKSNANNGEMWIFTNTTVQVEFKSGGSVYSLSPDTFGHFFTNINVEITIDNNDPTEVDSGMVAGLLKDVTFEDSHYLSVQQAGTYLVNWGMSAAMASASGGIEFEIGVMVDGVSREECQAHRTLANSTDTGNAASNCILALVDKNQVSLSVTNESSTINIDVNHANLSITRIGP